MKGLKISGIVLGVIIVALVVTISLQSPLTNVERTIVVAAAPAVIFPYFNDLRKSNEWSHLVKVDPKIQQRYEGPPSGIGNKMTWTSLRTDLGNGSQWIVDSEENKRVKTEIHFDGFDGRFFNQAVLIPTDGGTLVKYSYSGDLSDTGVINTWVGKFFGMFTISRVGKEYEEGLNNLKDFIEGQPRVTSESDSTLIQ